MAIKVDPDLLDERATQYRNQGNALETIIKELDTLKQTLQNEYEGNSATRFISQYDDTRPSIVSVNELMFDLATELNKQAENFRIADGQG